LLPTELSLTGHLKSRDAFAHIANLFAWKQYHRLHYSG
jgi:hypothetical protein